MHMTNTITEQLEQLSALATAFDEVLNTVKPRLDALSDKADKLLNHMNRIQSKEQLTSADWKVLCQIGKAAEWRLEPALQRLSGSLCFGYKLVADLQQELHKVFEALQPAEKEAVQQRKDEVFKQVDEVLTRATDSLDIVGDKLRPVISMYVRISDE
jgi:hypothetical protein